MRSDMAKVVTESPREGYRLRSQKFGYRLSKDDIHRELEDDSERGGRVPWSRCRNKDHKNFSDVLGPLRAYLKKQVGRPWDKVWSEICATLDRRSLTGLHIFDHIKLEVDTHTRFGVDGRIYGQGRWYSRDDPVEGLYVHPRTGLLCNVPRTKYRWNEEGEREFRVALKRFGIYTFGADLRAYRIDGLRLWEKRGGHWFINFYREPRTGDFDPSRRQWLRRKQAGKKEMWKVRELLERDPF